MAPRIATSTRRARLVRSNWFFLLVVAVILAVVYLAGPVQRLPEEPSPPPRHVASPGGRGEGVVVVTVGGDGASSYHPLP